MSFAIARFRKIKQQDNSKHNGVLIHNLRTEIHSNVNAEKSKFNQFLMGGNTPKAIKNDLNKRWQELEDNATRKTRKDAVGSLELILTASNDYFTDDNVDTWAKANIDFAIAEYGQENIISAILHMDETTPHIHLLIVPVVNGKLNAKVKVGNKLAMSQYQNRYAVAMDPLGLIRGKCSYAENVEPTKHQDPSQYIKELKQTNQDQAKEINKLKTNEKLLKQYLKHQGLWDKFLLWLNTKNIPLKRTETPLESIFDNLVDKSVKTIKKLIR
jgi:hypothetical protein